MPVIEVSKLGKDFSAGRARVRALADVSFSVEEGQFVTLVGPSGCGKSTLLQILAGLIAATRGEVRIEGERICAPMPNKISMVFQDPTLLPWKTALANVEFHNFSTAAASQWLGRPLRGDRAEYPLSDLYAMARGAHDESRLGELKPGLYL